MFSRAHVLRTWAGIVDVAPDASPIIGRTPVDGLYINCGWGTGGFKATPGAGWVIAHTVAHNAPHRWPRPSASTVSPGRADRRARRRRGGPLMLLIIARGAGRATRSSFATAGRRTSRTPPTPARWTTRTGREYLFMRDNPKGPFRERWRAHGRLPPLVQRGARHRHQSHRARVSGRRMRRLATRRFDRSLAADSVHVRWPDVDGLRGRHARLGAVGQRRPNGGPQRRARSAARCVRRGRRGAERVRRACALATWWSRLLRATQVALAPGLEAWSTRGRASLPDRRADARRFDKMWAHCDVLVVGGGPAGLAEAARSRPRRRSSPAGRRPAARSSRSSTLDGLRALPEVQLLSGATAFGLYEANCVMVAQAARLWQVRARQVVVATGAHERPLVFADNDRPGVMLASAARSYAHRYGVAVGTRCVVFTNNDSAYDAAVDLAAAGIDVAAIVDIRPDATAEAAGIDILRGQAVVGTDGDPSLQSVLLSDGRRIECDVLAVSGGFNPVVASGQPGPGTAPFRRALRVLRPGVARRAPAHRRRRRPAISTSLEPSRTRWLIEAPDGAWDRHFVDLHRDTTVADMRRGLDAGLRSIEHVKRFTTGRHRRRPGQDGGRRRRRRRGRAARPGRRGARHHHLPAAVRAGQFAAAGRARPRRRCSTRSARRRSTPGTSRNGAVFEDVGQWKRPVVLPASGRGHGRRRAARVPRGARRRRRAWTHRRSARSTSRGRTPPSSSNRLYTNTFDRRWRSARCRYGLMCRADGMVFDDGVVMRLADDRFLMTTTTGNAAAVLDWMEEWLQTEWPDLRVRLTSVTEQWATIAVVGPRAREVLRPLTRDIARRPRARSRS